MGYYRGTVLLEQSHSTIQVNRLLGVSADLNQVGDAIHGLENFLESKISESSWELGTLVIPTDAQLRKTKNNSDYKRAWTLHLESMGGFPPPETNIPNTLYRQEKKILAQARSLYDQMMRHLEVSTILVERQQYFLLSGDWMDKTRLTILEVADQFSDWGEKTVRDSIHSLRFNLNGTSFSADTLICASEMPYVCKKVMQVRDKLPDAGAPMLAETLNQQGLNTSQRMIGNALKMINKHELRQLA